MLAQFTLVFSEGLALLVFSQIRSQVERRRSEPSSPSRVPHYPRRCAKHACLVLTPPHRTRTRAKHRLPAATAMLVVFSTLVQASEGSTFAVVPFLQPKCIGVVAGIVGASGNIGAVGWGLLFKFTDSYEVGFLILGFIVTGLSFMIFLCPVDGTYFHRPFGSGDNAGGNGVDATMNAEAPAIESGNPLMGVMMMGLPPQVQL